jgi:hypothetical protein
VSDFPRGWTQSVDGSGAAQSITIAGVPGVSHVLDAFSAKYQNTTAVASTALVRLSSSDGTYNNFVLGRVSTAVPAAGSLESDSIGGSELNLVATPGASITVSFSFGAANINETLVIQGHDV